MVNSLWPVNAVNGSPALAGRYLRQTASPFLAGATAARPLGSRSGVRPGTPATSVTASSTTVIVSALAGIIDGETANEAGAYQFAFDAVTSFTSSTPDPYPAADQNNPRIDIVYVQVSDPSEGDNSTTPAITMRYLAGTPAASPAAPATPARSFVIAQVNVPKVNGGSPSVTWVAPYMAAAGGVVQSLTLAALRLTQGTPGQYATVFADTVPFNNGLYRWNSTTSNWDNAAQQHWLSAWYNTAGGGSYHQVAGLSPIFQGGQALGKTSSGGVLSTTFPNAFPNGITGVLLMPTQNSNGTPVLVEGSLSTTGFQTFWSGEASTNVNVPYLAVGS